MGKDTGRRSGEATEIGLTLEQLIRRGARQLIQSALERNGGIQTRAAEELGINERVLRYKMKKYKFTERE